MCSRKMLDELWIIVNLIRCITMLRYLMHLFMTLHDAEVRRHEESAVKGLEICSKKRAVQEIEQISANYIVIF